MTSCHEPVAFPGQRRYNRGLNPATLPLFVAFGRENPFLNSTEARIIAAPSRSRPVVEICTYDDPGS